MIEKRSIPKDFKGFILKIVLLILLSYIEAKKDRQTSHINRWKTTLKVIRLVSPLISCVETQKKKKKLYCMCFNSLNIIQPLTTAICNSLNLVSSSPNDNFLMKVLRVTIPMHNTILSRLMLPEQLLLN